MALPTFAPMLASTQPPTGGAEWAFEPKLDGWRALAYVDGAVTVRTRTGRDATEYVDNLQALADLVGGSCSTVSSWRSPGARVTSTGSVRTSDHRVAGISPSSHSIC